MLHRRRGGDVVVAMGFPNDPLQDMLARHNAIMAKTMHEAEMRFFYGPTAEEKAKHDAWEVNSRCKPCCDTHIIRFDENECYIDVSANLHESTPLTVVFCPACGKRCEKP